jgi:predicted AAA+ superfamily ATPase
VGSAPEALFEADAPILFDEWQVAPRLWNLVRREVDDRSPRRGLFILTGSATPDDDIDRHSGAGRISTLRMRPMSLFETGHSTGQVSLRSLFDGDFRATRDPGLSVPRLMERLVIGGWPALLDADVPTARQWIRDYLSTIVADVQLLDGRRSPERLRRLLTSLGRAVGTDTTIKVLAADVGGAAGPADRDAVSGYLAAFERLLLVEDVPAWAPRMRSTTPLRRSATRFLTDPSLGVGALGVGPEQLLADLNATGFHFEALVVRDLRVYTQPIGGRLGHWRDNNGHEVDVVVTLDDGRWGALEVKMNPDDIDAAAGSLLRFAAKVDTSTVGGPAFLGVVTTRAAALRRPDGVLTLPIATLGP